MVQNVIRQQQEPALEPVDPQIDHVRGSPAGRVLLEYGDYECPYSRQAFRQIERVEAELGGGVRFAFRHFPLTGIHPHALAAATAAEAAALQGRFWDMHETLFRRQRELEDGDLRRHATGLGLDVAAFDRDRTGSACWSGFAGTWKAGLRQVSCGAPRRCSSMGPCTGEPTTWPRCWKRWHGERDLRTPVASSCVRSPLAVGKDRAECGMSPSRLRMWFGVARVWWQIASRNAAVIGSGRTRV